MIPKFEIPKKLKEREIRSFCKKIIFPPYNWTCVVLKEVFDKKFWYWVLKI